MARLPSLQWLVQEVDGVVSVFREGDEKTIVEFNARNGIETMMAMKPLWESTELSDEDKCFAIFWCGYFHASFC